MFSVHQKREIADAIHRILRGTEHPESKPARRRKRRAAKIAKGK
jgi:hypothetical protein